MTAPSSFRVQVGGSDLAAWEWPGQGTPVLLVHAAGFHSRCWELVVEHLPGRHCIAFDFPGHGHSAKPLAPWSWPFLGDFVAGVVPELGLQGCVAVGHSMGGYAVARAAALDPSPFGGLVLVDPVIFAPDRVPGGGGGADGASRRRSSFASPEEMFERFRDRHPFNRWQEQALRDYCEHGLLPASDDNGYVLACEPALEAEVYRTARQFDLDLSRVALPVRILRARMRLPDGSRDMTCSPSDPALAARFPSATDRFFPELGHHMPMEAPAVVAAEIEALIAQT